MDYMLSAGAAALTNIGLLGVIVERMYKICA